GSPRRRGGPDRAHPGRRAALPLHHHPAPRDQLEVVTAHGTAWCGAQEFPPSPEDLSSRSGSITPLPTPTQEGHQWRRSPIIAMRTGATLISNFEIVAYCQKQGVANAHPMHIGGSHAFPFGRAKLTVAFHGSSFPDGTYGGNPAGILLEI